MGYIFDLDTLPPISASGQKRQPQAQGASLVPITAPDQNQPHQPRRRWSENCFDHQAYGLQILEQRATDGLRIDTIAAAFARQYMAITKAYTDLYVLAQSFEMGVPLSELVLNIADQLQNNLTQVQVRTTDKQ